MSIARLFFVVPLLCLSTMALGDQVTTVEVCRRGVRTARFKFEHVLMPFAE
jgi:hypothetical protein